MEACRRVDEIASLAARAKGAVAGFNQVMTAIAGHLADGAGPGRMVEFAAQESGYLAELEEDRTVEAQGRIENIQELSGVAAELLARDPDAGLDEFLEQVSLDRRAGRLRRGGVVGHADDAAHRQGARVPARVHRRPRGRDLPALPVDDRLRPSSRRSAGCSTWGSRGRRSASTSATRGAGRCSGRRTTTRRRGS